VRKKLSEKEKETKIQIWVRFHRGSSVVGLIFLVLCIYIREKKERSWNLIAVFLSNSSVIGRLSLAGLSVVILSTYVPAAETIYCPDHPAGRLLQSAGVVVRPGVSVSYYALSC
jgi:hypothetical protein